MKVLCINPFYDLLEKVDRNPGDVFDVTEERFAEIEASQYAPLVQADEEKPKKRKRTEA